MIDVGRYGFVMLKYYMPPHGFEENEAFTNSRALFDKIQPLAVDTNGR